jgi:hypothetical protein
MFGFRVWSDLQCVPATPPQEASEGVLFETDDRIVVPETDDYWNSGYGRIIMVPRVKLAYDKVSPSCARKTLLAA